MRVKIIMLLVVVTIFFGCVQPKDPNVNSEGKDELKSLVVTKPIEKQEAAYHNVIYVPIYSDLYIDAQNQNHLLSATLSIRNSSFQDSLFISKIDYYNTNGKLVKKFINNSISLPPMATVNYVIEKEDNSGGAGANFIVELQAKKSSVKPIIQAVMIGQYSNKAFSFAVDGYSIK